MTTRPDQHDIDPEVAGTTDHTLRTDDDDPPADTETDQPEDTPPPPPSPRELLEQQRKQVEADRADKLERARENDDED